MLLQERRWSERDPGLTLYTPWGKRRLQGKKLKSKAEPVECYRLLCFQSLLELSPKPKFRRRKTQSRPQRKKRESTEQGKPSDL